MSTVNPPRLSASSGLSSILSRPTPKKTESKPKRKNEDFEDNIHAPNFDDIKNMPTGNYHKLPNLSKIEPNPG